MIVLQDIVDKVTLETGFSCELALEKMPILKDFNDLPHVFIGYLSEEPASPESAYSEGDPLTAIEYYAQITTDIFSIQIITTMPNLIAHKEAVKSALLGWNPVPTPNEFGSFRTGRGTVHALINGRVHWFQELIITQPSI